MEDMKRYQIPKFGNWDYFEELPITQYFESAAQAGLVRGGHCFGAEEAELFNYSRNHRKQYSGGEKEKEKQRKQGRVCDVGEQQSPRVMKGVKRAPRAVDEDLYKIPPELLYPKPKRKRMLRILWSGCIGVSCVA